MGDRPERRDDAGWERFLERFDERQADLARRARAAVIDEDPEVVEVLWPHQGTAGWGVGPRKMSEHYAWLQAASTHVSLGFNYGSRLPDPAGLLEGTGANMRHVKLRTPGDADRPEVRGLLRAARTERLEALGAG